MKKAAVIGSGLGGLSTALRLKNCGYSVDVFEKQSSPGGRSNAIVEDGYRIDTGPTILLMKEYLEEFYRSIGFNLDDRLKMIQLDPNYRIYFHDDSYLELWSNMPQLAEELERFSPGSADQFFQFLGASAKKYELGMSFVNRNYDHITDLANPIVGYRLLKTSAHQKLYKQVSRYFNGNEKLAKAFSFHSMFLGLSPFDALAMYSMITYADMAFGMWYPAGGIYAIIEDMMEIAGTSGISIKTNSPVTKIDVSNGKVRGIHLKNDDFYPCDIVVSNADLPYTYRELLPPEYGRSKARVLQKKSYACSGYLLYLGIDRVFPDLQHQSLYFADDYRANMDEIFVSMKVPESPSFHLNIPTQTNPDLAPPGHSIFYILAPVANLQSNINWQESAPVIREKLISRVENLIDSNLRKHIVWEKEYLPTDFQKDINAEWGTAFGSLSQHFFQSAYFRPHNYDHQIHGLYFVGQSTYPGIGIPMVLISSRLVVERIINQQPP
jgi:phytoene desaturase